ncbi:RNA ligase 1-like [Ylistrum balloti]|uniref:RNA ligase 1-like n=1 Tax=Ylistrum balloti TaxID=509963 RepID=UPI0029058FD0|nr:RNA ligase 1-like [Ylistrum balloti]
MAGLGSVQQKIPCVYETTVLNEPSKKRSYQQYNVVATNTVRQIAKQESIDTAVATEKLDGTCVFISEFQGKPWLWARLDRKPNKAAEKRFKKFQTQRRQGKGDADDLASTENSEVSFPWEVPSDFKEVPEHWIPASGVPISNGQPQPDANGHIPGWVPVDPKSRQHCWHLTAVDLTHSIGLVLREKTDEGRKLQVDLVNLSELLGKTAELIGTHVNGNPYGIGNKATPLHLMVLHGSIKATVPCGLHLEEVRAWLEGNNSGRMEGVVWHCESGSLYKLHRHHVNLPWPMKDPTLSQRPVSITVDITPYEVEENNTSCLWTLSKLNGQTCDSLPAMVRVLDMLSSHS